MGRRKACVDRRERWSLIRGKGYIKLSVEDAEGNVYGFTMQEADMVMHDNRERTDLTPGSGKPATDGCVHIRLIPEGSRE